MRSAAAFTDGAQAIDLIELGAGDGTKTAVLIEHFLKQNIDFNYSPIDISKEACDALLAKFNAKFPELKIHPHHGDYFKILDSLKNGNGRRKVILFLGSNIGNFSREQAVDFFRHLRLVMNENDRLFIGFDMQKDPRVIVRAYDDAAGVTAAFNLNLLRRINRELGADFDLENFSHYAQYRPGRMCRPLIPDQPRKADRPHRGSRPQLRIRTVGTDLHGDLAKIHRSNDRRTRRRKRL